MDPGQSTSSTRLQHGGDNNFDFLGGIQNYANTGDADDMQQYFHPDLFEGQDFGNTMQSQPQRQSQQPTQQNYQNSAMTHVNAGGQQSSPLPAYNQTHQYAQQPHYNQQTYDQRSMYSQQAYDPRMFQQRPSQSPAPIDQYVYNNQFTGQNGHGLANIQPRPSQSPAPQYPPRQQSYSPFMTFDSRGPALPQHQDADLMQFAGFQNTTHTQAASQSYINPSMLNSGAMNGHYQQMQQRQSAQGLYYPKPDPVVGQSFPQQYQQHLQQNVPPSMQPNQMQGTLPSLAPSTTMNAASAKDPLQVKKVGRPRKDGLDGGSGSASSDSDLEIEEEGPESAPAMISVGPPGEERARAVYDAVKAVWSPRNKTAPTEKIKTGVIQFGDIVKGLRDQWKARNDSLKKAEADGSPTASDAPRLREETAQYRSTMETLVLKATTFAHQAILRSLGENVWTLSALYSFMLDRVSALDYDGSLLLMILRMAVKMASLDDEKLESSKWNKLLQRVSKKSSGEAKDIALKILDNARRLTVRKAEEAKAGAKGNSDLAAGVKRQREGDSVGPAAKKAVRPSSKPLALQNAERRKAEAAEAAKKGKTAVTPAPSGTLITPATKAKPSLKATAPPTSSISSLLSASKKPGTSNAERAAAKAKDGSSTVLQQVKKEPIKRDSPPATSISAPAVVAGKGSSFLNSLFSGLDKKEETKTEEKDEITGETPEDKHKRTRKEARRKLRVSWKNDNELVETRLFTHDPDEEINQGDSAKRDAGDSGKEGEMLKRHRDMEEIDDEDEEDGDFDPDCYTPPSSVDFSEMASEDCDPEANGVKHGGKLVPESKAKEAQDNFETTVLMVFYTPAEQPETPKEPADEADDDFSPVDAFGEPEDKVRTREKDLYARQRSIGGTGSDGVYDFASSLSTLQGGSTAHGFSAHTSQPPPTDILSQLAMYRQQQPPLAAPAPTQQVGGFDLASIIATLKTQQSEQLTPQPPQQQQQPAYQAPPGPDLSAILAQFQNQQPQPQPAASAALPYTAEDYAFSAPVDSNGAGKKGKKKGKGNVPLDENGLPLNYKTKTCEFWEKGMCNKGESCTFKHSN